MQPLIFTKKPTNSGSGYLVWIPKEISDHLSLTEKTFVEIEIRNLGRKKLRSTATFVKKISKINKNTLVWIPKDISEFLMINKNCLLELQLLVLQRQFES